MKSSRLIVITCVYTLKASDCFDQYQSVYFENKYNSLYSKFIYFKRYKNRIALSSSRSWRYRMGSLFVLLYQLMYSDWLEKLHTLPLSIAASFVFTIKYSLLYYKMYKLKTFQKLQVLKYSQLNSVLNVARKILLLAYRGCHFSEHSFVAFH